MVQDPRHRNKVLNTASLEMYKSDYAVKFQETLTSVSSKEMEKACEAIRRASENGFRIYVAGNGGSAAIADHLCCDWTKGTFCDGHETIATQSLSSNVALYTAIANDYGFEVVFATQIKFFGKAGDVLVAISSSGNSPNIIKAVQAAREKGMFVIGFSGFSGGLLSSLSDASLHANIDNYGVVEDVHQALMHIMAQYIAFERDGKQSGN